MKTKLLFIAIVLFSALGTAQKYEGKREKIKALKIAYITDKLELTSSEAQKFWPVYNAFDEKKFTLHHKTKRNFKKPEGDSHFNLSEKEASQLLVEIEKNEEILYQARKKFMTDVKKILPAKKILLLKKVEDDFNRKLLHEFKGRKR